MLPTKIWGIYGTHECHKCPKHVHKTNRLSARQSPFSSEYTVNFQNFTSCFPFADNHRYQPGSGAIDFHSAFDQLRADGYDGYIVYECRIRADDPAQAYRQSLDFLRQC
ncbi:hypothetical protein C3D71_07225 [Cronobacter sakazakii]|nr:hypothetical protein C3D71_07225 [Cronobacter sakazakii]